MHDKWSRYCQMRQASTGRRKDLTSRVSLLFPLLGVDTTLSELTLHRKLKHGPIA